MWLLYILSFEEFMTTIVQSYYHSGSDIAMDVELQTWITEAVPAQIIDFPPAPLTKRSTLIDMLTHLAFLATVVHHTLNANDPVTSTAMLPFHPASLYSPVRTSKGVTDLPPFLPPTRAIHRSSRAPGLLQPLTIRRDESYTFASIRRSHHALLHE
jgi:hypothetical protein